jgi:hypothetical protein
MHEATDGGEWPQPINCIRSCDLRHSRNDGLYAIVAQLSSIKSVCGSPAYVAGAQNSSLSLQEKTIMYKAETAQAPEGVGKKKTLRLGILDTHQYNSVANLKELGDPKTGQIDPGQLTTYQEVLEKFGKRYHNGRNDGPAYRLGSYRFVPHDENTAGVYFGGSIIDRPNIVDDGGSLLINSESRSMVVDLAPFVIGLLENNHYMEYLKSKGLLDPTSKFLVEVAMDFYRDRAGAVGFHKDSLDLTSSSA